MHRRAPNRPLAERRRPVLRARRHGRRGPRGGSTPDRFHELHLDDLIADPAATLQRACAGSSTSRPPADYLDACQAIVFAAPRPHPRRRGLDAGAARPRRRTRRPAHPSLERLPLRRARRRRRSRRGEDQAGPPAAGRSPASSTASGRSPASAATRCCTSARRVRARRHRDDFAAVRTFLLFVGHPRSGHSLVGSLLDAHPDVVVSHELDALEVRRRRLPPRPAVHARARALEGQRRGRPEVVGLLLRRARPVAGPVRPVGGRRRQARPADDRPPRRATRAARPAGGDRAGAGLGRAGRSATRIDNIATMWRARQPHRSRSRSTSTSRCATPSTRIAAGVDPAGSTASASKT